MADIGLVVFEQVKMKVTYVENIDVNILENLCSTHQQEFDEGATIEGGYVVYDDAIVNLASDCDDCKDEREKDALRQADDVEITKYDQPWSVEILD